MFESFWAHQVDQDVEVQPKCARLRRMSNRSSASTHSDHDLRASPALRISGSRSQ